MYSIDFHRQKLIFQAFYHVALCSPILFFIYFTILFEVCWDARIITCYGIHILRKVLLVNIMHEKWQTCQNLKYFLHTCSPTPSKNLVHFTFPSILLWWNQSEAETKTIDNDNILFFRWTKLSRSYLSVVKEKLKNGKVYLRNKNIQSRFLHVNIGVHVHVQNWLNPIEFFLLKTHDGVCIATVSTV